MSRIRGAVLAAGICSLVASSALAQNTGGRTDGPEGSELSHGGYTSDSSGGHFSLALNWGASVQESQPLHVTDAPLFFGLTASFWADQVLSLDVQGQYLVNNHRVNAFIGPKVRTAFDPISLYAAARAGAILVPNKGLRFGLSPEVGAELLVKRKVTLGLAYAPDFAIGGDTAFNHRIFMNLGYRF